MKIPYKDKPVRTVPEGAWEGGTASKENPSKKRNPNDITTDSQGNGYPVFPKQQDG